MHGDLLLDAELLIGELATDVLADGGRRVILHARLADDRLFVEVIGQDLRSASGWHERACAAGGGLDIVEDLSSRWGVHAGTSHVWFELQR